MVSVMVHEMFDAVVANRVGHLFAPRLQTEYVPIWSDVANRIIAFFAPMLQTESAPFCRGTASHLYITSDATSALSFFITPPLSSRLSLKMEKIIDSVKAKDKSTWICRYRCVSHSIRRTCSECGTEREVGAQKANDYIKEQMAHGYPDPTFSLLNRGPIRVENGEVFRIMKYVGFDDEKFIYKLPENYIPPRPSLCDTFHQRSVALAKPSKKVKHTKTVCDDCGVQETPLWRYNRLKTKTFCNACGIRRKRRS